MTKCIVSIGYLIVYIGYRAIRLVDKDLQYFHISGSCGQTG